MNQIFVKPSPGLVVRDPINGQILAAEGEVKPRSTYWLRRLRDGDVQEGPLPAAEVPATEKRSSRRE